MKYKNVLHIIVKVLFSIILVMSILGAFGIFPEPTHEMYNTDTAYNFIMMIMHEAGYISVLMLLVHIVALIALWTQREPLALVLEFPIILNVVGFHAFLDGGLFTAGAMLGNLYFILGLCLLWYHRKTLQCITTKRLA